MIFWKAGLELLIIGSPDIRCSPGEEPGLPLLSGLFNAAYSLNCELGFDYGLVADTSQPDSQFINYLNLSADLTSFSSLRIPLKARIINKMASEGRITPIP